MAERVLLTITTTTDDGERHVLTLDTPLDGRRLGELHEVARTIGAAAAILGEHTQTVGVEVSFPS
jgi:hypothetical protein